MGNCRMKCLLLGVCMSILLLGGCSLFHSTSAVIEVSQTRGTVPLAITYDASASEGKDGITTYRWLFGDGGEAYGPSGSYTFDHAGEYRLELTVRAADGSMATEAMTIVVEAAFWVADENLNQIYKLNASGEVIQTLACPVSQPRGLTLAEREGEWVLFVACMGDGMQRLLKLNPETGAVLAQYTAPAGDPGGLTYAPAAPFRLWHVDKLSRKIYEINPADGQTLNVFGATYFQSSPHLGEAPFLQTPGGVAWKEGPLDAGSLWVVESETRLLYELKIVPAIDIFSSTQLELRPNPVLLPADLFPISGFDWHEGFVWVVDRNHHQVVQVDPATGAPTGVVLSGFPGAAVSGLAIQK